MLEYMTGYIRRFAAIKTAKNLLCAVFLQKNRFGGTMITLLSKIFVKDRDNTESSSVRGAYGTLCSIVGILLNILLFLAKLIAGAVSGAISVTADAFNN